MKDTFLIAVINISDDKRCISLASGSRIERYRSATCVILTGMKTLGFLLLLSGWILVLSAVSLLKQPGARTGFVLAGLAVELLGLVLVVRSHISSAPERN